MSEHEYSGDPGHHGIDPDEMRIALAAPCRRTPRRIVQGTFGPAGHADHDSDFGYDQAHEA